MLESAKISSCDVNQMKSEAAKIQSGMGVVAWAVLEMFKRGGMPEKEITELHENMNRYFAKPSNDECNAILKVVETRVQEDKEPGKDIWYVSK